MGIIYYGNASHKSDVTDKGCIHSWTAFSFLPHIFQSNKMAVITKECMQSSRSFSNLVGCESFHESNSPTSILSKGFFDLHAWSSTLCDESSPFVTRIFPVKGKWFYVLINLIWFIALFLFSFSTAILLYVQGCTHAEQSSLGRTFCYICICFWGFQCLS